MVHEIKDGEIFVFGSNKAGRHGAGAARTAHQFYGAKYGCGEGLSGHSYAIPTKGQKIEKLTLKEIKEGVDRFILFATKNPNLQFFLTRIGCGLAGYTDNDICPLFKDSPKNVRRPPGW